MGNSVSTGFVLGSLTTFYVLNFVFAPDESKEKKSGSEPGATTSPRSLRGAGVSSRSIPLSPSAAAATVVHVGFLTDIVRELWDYIRVMGADSIRESVEPTLKETMKGLSFTKIDLGRTPMRFDNVIVHEIKDGAVQFDLDFIWVTDCEIKLKADYIGSFGIKAIELNGRMSFLLKPLTTDSSIVSGVQYAFINPPHLELDFSGLAALADSSWMAPKIAAILQDSMSCVVLPNRMTYKNDPACSFFDIYEPPLGIARITTLCGRGFVIEKRRLQKDDIPDVYCKLSLGAGTEKQTATIKDNLSPVWKDEHADFVLADNDQVLCVHAWDEDKGMMDSDDDLGLAKVTVGEILLAGKTKELELQQDDKCTGAFVKVHCDVCKFTTDLSSMETANASVAGNNMLCGLLTILVTQAFDLPVEKEKASSFVKVKCGDSEFVTGVVEPYPGVDALNPLYDCVFHVPIAPDMVASSNGVPDVTFHLMNGATSPVELGTAKVTYTDLQAAPEHVITEQRKLGDSGAAVEFRLILRGVAPGQSPPAAAEALPRKAPVEVSEHLDEDAVVVEPPSPTEADAAAAAALERVRITAVKGQGFQIEKRRGFRKDDIPDVYLKVKYGSSPTVWRTSTIKNDCNPKWNESSEYILSDHGQIINIDAFDEDKGSKDPDDFLGTARVAVGKLLLAGGTKDVELLLKGNPTGCFITLQAEMVTA